MTTTYIERHYSLSVSAFEGLWDMTFMHPFNREEHVSIYLVAPNSDYDSSKLPEDKPVVEAGPRMTDFLNHLLYKIEYYPYTWDFSGKKLVSYGYDFESDYNGSSISSIDLTEIAFKELNEYYNFFSPLEAGVVKETDVVSGKGVMTKIEITLDKPKYVNDLNIDFFTQYPIELITLMYKADESKESTTHELPLSKIVQTNSSVHLHFAPVFAKTFFLIIKQESYSLVDGTQSEEQAVTAELWQQATDASKGIYESSVGSYMSELFATKSAVELHQSVLDSYQPTDKDYEVPSAQAMNAYREDFTKTKAVLDSEQR